MRKYIYLFIILFIIPIMVKAEGIENYYINATILDNGDLEVEEYFNLTGYYNGFERIINYANNYTYDFNKDASSYGGSSIHNGDGITILDVKAVDVNSNFDFSNIDGEVFNKVFNAEKGEYGVYTNYSTYDGTKVKIFLPSSYNKAFYIKYKLHNMAIYHNDVGELGWNVVGDSLTEYIDNLVVYINIPNNQNEIRVWGHGPLNGHSEIISKDKVKAEIKNLSSNTAIDVRVVFDNSVIFNSNKKTDVDALDKIILYETDEAAKANYEREQSDYSKIISIEEYFRIIEDNSSRATYNLLEVYINSLDDENKKNSYMERLMSYKDRVDEYEYTDFRKKIDKCISNNYSYNYYRDATNIINHVFSDSMKNKMEEEVKPLRKHIVNNEWKLNLLFVLISFGGILISYLYIRFNKSFQVKKGLFGNVDYIREIPSNLSPSAVGLLLDKRLGNEEVSATILDLIRRGVITYDKKDNGSYDLNFNSGSKNVSPSENALVRFVFDGKSKINTKKIKKLDYDRFTSWRDKVLDELEDGNYIKKYTKKDKGVNAMLLVFGYILLVPPATPIGLLLLLIYSIKRYQDRFFIWFGYPINIAIIVLTIISCHFVYISIIISIIVMILVNKIIKSIPNKISIKVTDDGKNEIKKWNGLKKFLLDFSIIDQREIPEVSLWEEYLVYATVFGVGKEVLKKMKVKIEMENLDTSILENYVLFNSINDVMSLTSSINEVGRTIAPMSMPKIDDSSFGSGSSDYSSGGGSGGGFSGGDSGGGSFGGGGGGGRF